MCLFSLFISLHALWNDWSPFFFIQFCIEKLDFRGQWSVSPKNRGLSKKTQGRTGLKRGGGGGSLVVLVVTFKEAVPPPGLRSYQGDKGVKKGC